MAKGPRPGAVPNPGTAFLRRNCWHLSSSLIRECLTYHFEQVLTVALGTERATPSHERSHHYAPYIALVSHGTQRQQRRFVRPRRDQQTPDAGTLRRGRVDPPG